MPRLSNALAFRPFAGGQKVSFDTQEVEKVNHQSIERLLEALPVQDEQKRGPSDGSVGGQRNPFRSGTAITNE